MRRMVTIFRAHGTSFMSSTNGSTTYWANAKQIAAPREGLIKVICAHDVRKPGIAPKVP